MNDEIPADIVTDLLLPDDLRGELCIASITIADYHRLLLFRIDPGNAFERRGYLRSFDDNRYLAGLGERYLPDDKMNRICGSDGIPVDDIADQLRCLSTWAHTWDAGRDHWLDARTRLPDWSRRQQLISAATFNAADCARQERVTYFVHGQPGEFTYGTNPPATGKPFYSITPLGDWSLHEGTATYPMAAAPDPSSIARLTSRNTTRPTAVARTAQTASEPVVVPLLPRPAASRQEAAGQRKRR